jgi:hypothetical protein
MKKAIILLCIAFLSFPLAGCSLTTTEPTTTSTAATTEVTTAVTTTLASLEIPTNVQVVENVVTFDSVVGASRYRIRLSIDAVVVGEWFVNSGFDLSLLVDYGNYDIQVKAVGDATHADSEYGEKIAITLADPLATGILEAETMNDYTKIRWLGRTWYDDSTQRRYFWNTASGFTVAFEGTELKATFYATNYTVTGKKAHLVILLDGEEDPTKGTLLVLDQMQAEYILVSGLEDGYHTVKVLKRSEAQDSDTALVSVSTDGTFATPPAANDFRIQYIGASTSVGYGDLGPSSAAKTTDNSNGLLCYTYLASYLLDAETSIFASSGWGITRGWNTSGLVSATQTIPAAYEYFATNASNYVFTAAGEWDHTDYQPDVIVVALGGNDFSSSNYSSLNATDQASFRASVTSAYIQFLLTLHAYHPDAYIIVVYGLMSEATYVKNVAIDAAAQADAECGMVTSLLVAGAGSSGSLGSNYHPDVATYIVAARQLAECIESLTGHAIVREDIDW